MTAKDFPTFNLAALYAERAQMIADGDLPAPAKAFLFEFDNQGVLQPVAFGMGNDHDRERIQAASTCIAALSDMIRRTNARQAS